MPRVVRPELERPVAPYPPLASKVHDSDLNDDDQNAAELAGAVDDRRWDLRKTVIHDKYEAITVRHALPFQFDIFRGHQGGIMHVHQMLASHCPAPPEQLATAIVPPEKIYVIQTVKDEAEADDARFPFAFDTMVTRLPEVYHPKGARIVERLWREFLATNPALSPHYKGKQRKRPQFLPWIPLKDISGDSWSRTLAFHLGIWAKYKKFPYVTSESVQQTPETIAAMDKLLTAIKTYILNPIANIMKTRHPQMYRRALNCHDYVCSHENVKTILQARPALNLGPIAFAIAIKEGWK
ncbi:hypothetical protein DL96DRAFT_1722696 [Flagelloscypha sp. PMI_526]|nr:hypothetical protein DL96DRAFT_1722696 [Flagelloscypha sp. PMI_526]